MVLSLLLLKYRGCFQPASCPCLHSERNHSEAEKLHTRNNILFDFTLCFEQQGQPGRHQASHTIMNLSAIRILKPYSVFTCFNQHVTAARISCFLNINSNRRECRSLRPWRRLLPGRILNSIQQTEGIWGLNG